MFHRALYWDGFFGKTSVTENGHEVWKMELMWLRQGQVAGLCEHGNGNPGSLTVSNFFTRWGIITFSWRIVPYSKSVWPHLTDEEQKWKCSAIHCSPILEWVLLFGMLEHWCNDNHRPKTKYSEKNLSQCHLVHHKSFTWPGPERNPGLHGETPASNHWAMARPFWNTVELHLAGLIGTASHSDMQTIQIIGFFF
jgi:hypothetical protein